MHKENVTFTIRKIRREDENALAHLIRNVFEEYDAPRDGTVYSDPSTDHLFDEFQSKGAVLFVAAGEDLLGACGIFPTEGLTPHCAELVKFYLSPKARKHGIGTELLSKSMDWAKENGYKHIYLECFSQFKEALRLYEKNGFRYLDQRMGNSGHFGCGVWMLKEI